MACTSHTWIATTSDKYMKCSQCKAVAKARYGAPYEIVKAKSEVKMDWTASERRMLNKTQQPDYTDYEKAASDLRNYWQ